MPEVQASAGVYAEISDGKARRKISKQLAHGQAAVVLLQMSGDGVLPRHGSLLCSVDVCAYRHEKDIMYSGLSKSLARGDLFTFR